MENKEKWDGQCVCGHKHSEHGPTGSINYTAGRCYVKRCDCQHFINNKGYDDQPTDTPSSPSLDSLKTGVEGREKFLQVMRKECPNRAGIGQFEVWQDGARWAYGYLSPSTPSKEPGELDSVIESVADRMQEGEAPERDEFIDRHLAEIKRLKKYYADKATQHDPQPKKFNFNGDEQEWKEMSRSEKEECITPEWRLWNEKHKEPSDIPEEILEKIWIDAFQYATNRPQEDVGHIRQQGYVDGAIAMYRYSQKQPTTIDIPLSDVNFYTLKDTCVKQSIEIRFLKRQVKEARDMADRYLYENCRHTLPTNKK